ncbi:MAG: glycoside hydrolase family 32, partial [Acetatifactor sp.]|nr:glycoside hydrolase family 32 [Acetatifactor sp.]
MGAEDVELSGNQVQEPAEESEAGNVENYEGVPYRLYPTSENAWVGDVMPMADENGLQLYYLYDTDHNGVGYHPIYKFSTSNFYEYQDDGLVILYGSSAEEPDLAIGTGSVLKAQDGRYHCFYTGHNDTFPDKGLDKECVMHAVSEDNISWTKIPEDTFYAAEHYSGDDFRDPFVFWNEDEQCYWLLIAAHDEKLGGIVARYTSTDLSKWTLCDPLYAPEKQYMLEWPDLFRMGDYYYLFYSWDRVTYYAMSNSIYGPFAEPADNILD